jgi:mono/diheme cytochrome c family protein
LPFGVTRGKGILFINLEEDNPMIQRILILSVLFFMASATAQAAGDPVAGKAKFDATCATCHGPMGAGDGPAAAALNPKPRNLQITKRTDDELKKIIKEGGASVGMTATMPAWGAMLTDIDVDNVIAYIHTLAKPAGAAAPAAPAAPAKK